MRIKLVKKHKQDLIGLVLKYQVTSNPKQVKLISTKSIFKVGKNGKKLSLTL